MHKSLQDTKMSVIQCTLDFMFTTAPEYLSHGYRVQFWQSVNEGTREITNHDLIVETANRRNG